MHAHSECGYRLEGGNHLAQEMELVLRHTTLQSISKCGIHFLYLEGSLNKLPYIKKLIKCICSTSNSKDDKKK